jgi:hypothetical protein
MRDETLPAKGLSESLATYKENQLSTVELRKERIAKAPSSSQHHRTFINEMIKYLTRVGEIMNTVYIHNLSTRPARPHLLT